MRSRYKLLFIMLLPLALLLAGISGAYAHNFTGKVGCFECHEKIPLKGTSSLIKPNIEKVCIKCHPDVEKRLSHPVGMIPKILVPLDLPLDKEGRVSCITCHNIHMSSLNKITGAKTHYLRRVSKGRKFCYSCHNKIPIAE